MKSIKTEITTIVPLWVFSIGWRIDRDMEVARTVTAVDDDDDVPSWPVLPLLVRVRCSLEGDPDISSCDSSFSERAGVTVPKAGDDDFDFCDRVSDDRSIGAAPNICFQSSFCQTHNIN